MNEKQEEKSLKINSLEMEFVSDLHPSEVILFMKFWRLLPTSLTSLSVARVIKIIAGKDDLVTRMNDRDFFKKRIQ